MKTKLSRKIPVLIVFGAIISVLCGCKSPARVAKLSTPPSMAEIAKDAKAGKSAAQREVAARYASGNKLVKDEVLAEQWRIREDSSLSAAGGGNALLSLQKKRATEAEKSERAQNERNRTFENSSTENSENNVVAKHSDAKVSAHARARSVSHVPATTGKPENATPVQPDEFQKVLRAASQGNRLALERFRTDAEMRERLTEYAKTPEGKHSPFVREVMNKLKK